MMDLDKYIRFDSAAWGDTILDDKIGGLAGKYEITIGDKDVKKLSDVINLNLPENEDKRAYRKALQVFDLCRMQDVKVRGTIDGESRTIEVDGVLLGVFEALRDALIGQEYGGGDVSEIYEEIRQAAKEEERQEVLFRRRIIRETVNYLRGAGVFREAENPKNLGNKEGAFVYDLMGEIGHPLEQYYSWVKMTNKKKRDAITSYL